MPGIVVRKYEPGDIVSIFAPERGLGSDWKPKHRLQWRGPMEVVEVLSPTAYRMQERATGRFFERTVTNINHYRADPDKALAVGVHGDYKVGGIVAAKDIEDTDEIWLGQVLAVHEDSLELH